MKNKVTEITQLLVAETVSGTGILSGLGGQILACSEFFLHNKVSQDRLTHLHNVLEDRLSNEPFLFSYCDGLSGIGWLYEFLSQRKIMNIDTNLVLEDFDIYLAKALKNFMNENNYDFLHGGAGVALYFIKRVTKKKELVSVLAQFVDDLERLSIKQEDGAIKWSSLLNKFLNNRGYNISLSHGMSSIVAILSKLYKIEGIEKAKTETLLRCVVQYILAQEIDKDKYGSYFPYNALESTPEIVKSRLAWCYGDLGIASVLYQAGNIIQEKIWTDKALEILFHAAEHRKDLEDNLVKDACLCHGTAGIGHIFYRMWWNTKLSAFKKAADYWFEQTLKMATFEDGLAGYKIWEVKMPEGVQRWVNKYGLLEGIAGIGLPLLTYYYELEPEWDECLLLS